MEGVFLLTESNFMVLNQNFQISGCKIQVTPNFRGVLCNLAKKNIILPFLCIAWVTN